MSCCQFSFTFVFCCHSAVNAHSLNTSSFLWCRTVWEYRTWWCCLDGYSLPCCVHLFYLIENGEVSFTACNFSQCVILSWNWFIFLFIWNACTNTRRVLEMKRFSCTIGWDWQSNVLVNHRKRDSYPFGIGWLDWTFDHHHRCWTPTLSYYMLCPVLTYRHNIPICFQSQWLCRLPLTYLDLVPKYALCTPWSVLLPL